MSAANSNSERVHQPLPPPPLPLLPPLTINDNEYKNSKKKTKTKKRLVVDIDIGRSNIDVNIDKEKEKESLILVRDPPRERLARSRGPLVSADEGVHEEQLLARVAAGKQDVWYSHDHTVLGPTSTSTCASPSSSFGTGSACTTPCTTTTTTRASTPAHRPPSQAEEFYADIYQYYYDVTKPSSPSPSPSPPPSSGRDDPSPSPSTSTFRPAQRPRPPVPIPTPIPIENPHPPSQAMSKKRGSLQAIFVPSFLQSAITSTSNSTSNSTTTTPPPTPMEVSTPVSPPPTPGLGNGHGTAKYASRIRALSAAGHASKAHANAHAHANASGNGTANASASASASGEPHQRKRSMTFSMSLSMSSSLHAASSSFSAAPYIAPLDSASATPRFPTTPTIPTAAATPHTHTHAAAHSPRSSPPPAFLIDDDPFANLTSAPSESMGLGGGGGVGRFHHPPQAQAPVVVPLPPLPAPIPRSPLYETPVLQPLVVEAVVGAAALGSSSSLSVALVASDATVVASTSSSSTSTSTSTSTISPFASISTSIAPITSTSSLLKSPSSSSLSLSASLPKPPSLSAPSSPPAPPPPTSQRPRAPAAHQRPAFSPRPSLPSLDTLARMNIVLTKKVRKGRVGAGLPFEPWDLPSDDEGTLSPPAPPPSSAATSTSTSASNVTAVRHTPAMAATTPGGGNINANASNTNANTNAGQNSSQNYHPSTSTSTSISTSIITPAPVVSPSVSILSLSLSSLSSPPPLSSFSTISSPLPSPPLPLSPALSRSVSPSPLHVQHSQPSPSPSSPSPSTSSVTSTSSTTRSSASSTPPATATTSTFASASTSGYVPHPHPPLPPPSALHSSMQAPTPSPVPAPVQIARPQPLLPSQILALGSIAAEVEMVVAVPAPVPGPSYIPAPAPTPVRNETAGRAGVSEGFEYAWTKPASVSVSVARTSSYAHSPAPAPPPTMGSLPVVRETEAAGLHVDVDADVMEEEEPDGYFEDFLDRYQRPSRAGSEDEHGLEFWNGAEAEAEARVRERKEYVGVDVGGVVNELAGQDGDAGGASREDASETIRAVVGAERDSFAEEYSYLYASGKLGDDGADAEGDGESTAGLSSRSRSGPGVAAAAARFDSAVFSSPPSSASLSRSFSLRSDSSVGSADSAGAVEHAGGREGEEMWSYRRFAAPSRSLSSLELDLEGEGESEGAQGMSTESGYDVHSTEGELMRRGDSTRSSSSHPSLSRTRSSSDDSDVLQSPTPSDHDYSFFPYSHARTLAQIYQSSAGYSALFAPPVVSESFHYGPAGHGLSSSSSVEEVRGGAGAGWGGAFIAEPERGISIPEGLAADTDGDGGFGFGFDKVIVAVEDQDDVVEVKEKASLATTTSIDTVQPTSTALKEREADSLQSPPSSFPCNQHDLSLSASPNLSFVESGISPLVSESDSITQPTSLTSDDEMISRSNVMASGVPVRFRTTTTRPWTSGQPGDSTGYRSRGHSTTSSTSQPYRAGSSHAQTANNNASNSSYYSMGSRDYRSGRRRGDSDDEDGEEERRRRRALERMYANDGVAKIASSSLSDEDDIGTDNYGKPSASSSSKNHLAPRGTAAGSAISRSPSITGSFVTASSRSPSLKPMDFPASSKHSSSYVTEDEREEEDSSDDDDDVPLAQRIPGALTAQKTIRRQFREEREQRKREKALRMENGNAERRARQETLRPAGAGVSLHDGNGAAADSSSRDAAMHAASSVNALRRQRTTTLPGKSPTSATFNPHDLARKLQNVQLAEVSMPAYQQQQYLLQQQQQLALRQRSKSISRTSADHQQSFSPHSAASTSASSPATRNRSIKDPSSQSQRQFPPASPNSQTHVHPVSSLRPMRSFHPPPEYRSAGMDDPRFKPLPADAEQRLGRSVTSATRSHRPAAMDDPRSGALPVDAEHRLGRSATSATRNPRRRSPSQSRPSTDRGERSMEPVPPLPTNMHSRTSNDDPRKIHKVPNTTEPRISSTRTSGDVERAPRNASVQPPLPPLANKVVVSQQRVFVGNLQQFHMVEIGPSTTAGDVVTMMEAEGALTGWAGSGGWMVFEIAQDFGMERPVRSYELLADVQSSWLKDKSVNYFVLKLSPLAIPLSRNAIPTSSPTHSGYIEWEAKRGKWSKRWLQLREHNLYLAKRDNGKDEVLICSLSNFDAYTITRAHRAPKPFAFAIKSTDNLSFFENTADYLHNFSCSEKDGKIWMEKILVARSYVLHQERHILFNPKPTSNGGAAVTRAGTKKYAPIRSAQQPLVSLPPIGVAQSLPHHDVFEPGSLLAKH
ncbi:hypothetical protein CVT25_008868 [Psilocybe cyanescens]|uniref:PH domain-containing protein n=1 Tax=Psilocybe cyanescens TaxID=93625 RepID=A0A409VR78_PSICY|nr:hypothetical protein CVT25_008868 [Psilocybe cyanescens]